VLGHDQDSIGGGLDAAQAAAVTFDSIRVHDAILTRAQIISIAGGNSLPATSLWSNYCFSNSDNVGQDLGTQGIDFEIYGGVLTAGLTSCSNGGGLAAPVPSGPQAWHIPGGSISAQLSYANYNFPASGSTIEGFINVQPGSSTSSRYLLSYAAPLAGYVHPPLEPFLFQLG
jgi:hypothetical protein